jgi:drug/metabolite transporter (DMT)-like permease
MAADATAGRFRLASPATASILGVAVGGLTVAMFAACGVLLLLTRDYQRAIYGAGGCVAALVCLAVGFVVARRQPGNPVGWLLLGWALLTPVVGVALLYAVLDYRFHHGALPFGPVAVMAESAEFGIAVLAALTVLLFPDGLSQPRRWRWVLWVFLTASATFTAVLVARQALAIERHQLQIGPSGAPLAVPVAAGILAPLGWTADGLILVCWLIIVGRQVARYRHSAGNRRQQLKWLIGGAACCVVATTVTIFAGNYSSQAAQAVQDAADLGAAALPAAIGVGIVKYRLYDIDRIISRTLGYAIVTGLLVGVYLGLVLLASLVLPPYSPVTVAGSTLVAAALFHPLRRRVQRAVDRRFNRARYNADLILDAFAARLQDAVDLGTVRDELAKAVQAAFEPAHLSVWTREP